MPKKGVHPEITAFIRGVRKAAQNRNLSELDEAIAKLDAESSRS